MWSLFPYNPLSGRRRTTALLNFLPPPLRHPSYPHTTPLPSIIFDRNTSPRSRIYSFVSCCVQRSFSWLAFFETIAKGKWGNACEFYHTQVLIPLTLDKHFDACQPMLSIQQSLAAAVTNHWVTRSSFVNIGVLVWFPEGLKFFFCISNAPSVNNPICGFFFSVFVNVLE